MQVGSLEHASIAIKRKQADLALARLLKPTVDGKEPAYLLGLYVGEAQGLQLALAIIDGILNPADTEKKSHAR